MPCFTLKTGCESCSDIFLTGKPCSLQIKKNEKTEKDENMKNKKNLIKRADIRDDFLE
jgi:hypothetical protein